MLPLKLVLTRLSSPLSMGMAISIVWACANAASSVGWVTSCSMWAVTLVVGKHDFADVETKFKEMGFDRVFFPKS